MNESKKINPESELVLSVDPGLATIGWAVLEVLGQRIALRDSGAILTSSDSLPSERLRLIYTEMGRILDCWAPDVMAVEELFFAKNQTTALKVGQAVGVILLAGANRNLPVVEYKPMEVKMSVVGYGNAEKKQVQYMVTRILNLKEAPQPDDVADAMAIGICHATSRTMKRLTRTG